MFSYFITHKHVIDDTLLPHSIETFC